MQKIIIIARFIGVLTAMPFVFCSVVAVEVARSIWDASRGTWQGQIEAPRQQGGAKKKPAKQRESAVQRVKHIVGAVIERVEESVEVVHDENRPNGSD